MSVVGFRARISGFGGSGWQPCGQAPTYYPVFFRDAYQDDAGRYDDANCVWRPVAAGEAPRRVSLGAQVTILAGAKAVGNPIFSLKIQRNGISDVAAGQGAMDAGKPGFAELQVTTTDVAGPGDYYNVIILASAWTPGDPPIPFPSPWTRGSLGPAWGPGDYSALDNNPFHTYFWGTDDPDTAALVDRITALEAALAAENTTFASTAALSTLKDRVTALEATGTVSAAALAALAARVTKLEPPPAPGTFGAGTFGTGTFR